MPDFVPLGVDACLYVNTATGDTAYATPTWELIDNVADLSATDSSDTTELAIRRTGRDKVSIAGMTERMIAFSMVHILRRTGTGTSAVNTLDADVLLLRNAKDSVTVLDVMALDQPRTVTGATGQRGPFVVTKFDKGENNAEKQSYSVEMKRSYESYPWTRVTITATT